MTTVVYPIKGLNGNIRFMALPENYNFVDIKEEVANSEMDDMDDLDKLINYLKPHYEVRMGYSPGTNERILHIMREKYPNIVIRILTSISANEMGKLAFRKKGSDAIRIFLFDIKRNKPISREVKILRRGDTTLKRIHSAVDNIIQQNNL